MSQWAASSYAASATDRVFKRTLRETYGFIDYFPSYEMISSHLAGVRFYEPDRRRVTSRGVNFVMKNFFEAHPPPARKDTDRGAQTGLLGRSDQNANDEDVKCDEELLDTFGEV
jgi:hypothetical protein